MAEPRYERGIFFDNASHHIDEMKRFSTIISVPVDETASKHSLPIDSEEYRNFILEAELEGTTCDLVMTIMNRTISYDKRSGLNNIHFANFHKWASDNSHKKCVALFDWDRTLTVIEGLYLPFEYISKTDEITEEELNDGYKRIMSHHSRHPLYERAMDALDKKPITFADLVDFHCGGARRTNLMRSFFANCKSMGIDVIILTNNRGCNRPVYHQIVNALVNSTADYEVVCSAFSPYDAHKIRFIYMDSRFEMLRTHSGGGVGKKTKRKTRKHRKTFKKGRGRG